MGRQVRRVPLDFAHPLGQTWPGYMFPLKLIPDPCRLCGGSGLSPQAQRLENLWYGNGDERFWPTDTDCPVLTHETPAVVAFARRNLKSAPEYYGTGDWALRREAARLADLWNGQWCNHLTQDDVDALLARGRLMDFTHTWTKGGGWQRKTVTPNVTAAQVNTWSISGGMGHDSLNAHIVVQARCEREGMPYVCAGCDGDGSHEVHIGQRADAAEWERADPPTGEGWQLWETVSEGSPISPVFGSAEGLAGWMSSPAYHWGGSTPMDYAVALAFVMKGWAPTMVGGQLGEQFVGEAVVNGQG